ncbi:hypothetical protein DWW31_14425 [Clostridium sp. AF15-17LB]|nr:hypothetical protein DWW31_14425 [Clostridium sp. AF15-17LB]
MKRLWELINRVFQNDSATGVFLAVNIICWSAAALITGMVFCIASGSSVWVYATSIMCAAIYVGIIFGLFGGIIFLMRNRV